MDTEGVTITRSKDTVCIRLPEITSPHHQLDVIWQLHQIEGSIVEQARNVFIDVTALDDLPLSIADVLLVLEEDLRQRKCALRIVRAHSDGIRGADDKQSSGPQEHRQLPAISLQRETPGMSWAGKNGACSSGKREGKATTIRTENSNDFEQQLLGHIRMLYAVALKLTRNPSDAERITRSTVLHAWRLWNAPGDTRNLKAELLKLLRQTFLRHREVVKLRNSLASQELRPLIDVACGTASPPSRKYASARKGELVAAL